MKLQLPLPIVRFPSNLETAKGIDTVRVPSNLFLVDSLAAPEAWTITKAASTHARIMQLPGILADHDLVEANAALHGVPLLLKERRGARSVFLQGPLHNVVDVLLRVGTGPVQH